MCPIFGSRTLIRKGGALQQGSRKRARGAVRAGVAAIVARVNASDSVVTERNGGRPDSGYRPTFGGEGVESYEPKP